MEQIYLDQNKSVFITHNDGTLVSITVGQATIGQDGRLLDSDSNRQFIVPSDRSLAQKIFEAIPEGMLIVEGHPRVEDPVPPAQEKARLYILNNKCFVQEKVNQSDEIAPRNLSEHPFSIFNIKQIANNDVDGWKHSIRGSTLDRGGETDLHSHFAGVLTGEQLFDVMNEFLPDNERFHYPLSFVREMDIDIREIGDIDNEFVDLRNVRLAIQESVISKLSIPDSQIITFNDLEKIYKYREPFTKDRRFFEASIKAMGRIYEEQGIEYCSQSFGRISSLEWLEVAEEVLKNIKEKHGVIMRFLLTMPRLLHPSVLIARFNKFAGIIDNDGGGYTIYPQYSLFSSYCVTGVDFLGEEINQTQDFIIVLNHIAGVLSHMLNGTSIVKDQESLAKEIAKHFTLRIHAGESPYYPGNVETGFAFAAKKKDLHLRMGHGLYAKPDFAEIRRYVDYDKTLKKRIIMELNPDSNVSLNYLENMNDLPIAKYINADVPVVMGGDGMGIYRTNHAQIYSELTHIINVNVDFFTDAIKKSEELYKKRILDGVVEGSECILRLQQNNVQVENFNNTSKQVIKAAELEAKRDKVKKLFRVLQKCNINTLEIHNQQRTIEQLREDISHADESLISTVMQTSRDLLRNDFLIRTEQQNSHLAIFQEQNLTPILLYGFIPIENRIMTQTIEQLLEENTNQKYLLFEHTKQMDGYRSVASIIRNIIEDKPSVQVCFCRTHILCAAKGLGRSNVQSTINLSAENRHQFLEIVDKRFTGRDDGRAHFFGKQDFLGKEIKRKLSNLEIEIACY